MLILKTKDNNQNEKDWTTKWNKIYISSITPIWGYEEKQ